MFEANHPGHWNQITLVGQVDSNRCGRSSIGVRSNGFYYTVYVNGTPFEQLYEQLKDGDFLHVVGFLSWPASWHITPFHIQKIEVGNIERATP